MACPADHCRQPPQRTPPPLGHAGMPRHHPLPAALVRAPLPRRYGGWAATPLQTVPIAAPAIQARPFKLQDPLRLLSGRPNSCGTAIGPISPIHAALSKARAALAPRPSCTWAPTEALRRRGTPGSTAPPLSDCRSTATVCPYDRQIYIWPEYIFCDRSSIDQRCFIFSGSVTLGDHSAGNHINFPKNNVACVLLDYSVEDID